MAVRVQEPQGEVRGSGKREGGNAGPGSPDGLYPGFRVNSGGRLG